MQGKHQIKEVIQALGSKIDNLGLNTWQLRTLSAIKHCRTKQMGGRIAQCDTCGKKHLFYNSCRNRHCPSCQGHKREEWIQARESELLPVPYYHVVFTIPSELNTLALHQPKALYAVLFKTAWATLMQFGKTKGLQLGMISVLHTWGQNLSLHPHLHCIVPSLGLDKNGKPKRAGKNKKFLYSVKAMSKVFRAKFVSELRLQQLGSQDLYNQLFSKSWVVYAKKPFGSPKNVIEYLGRYTHKIAISNHRIKSITEKHVSFSYKDYKSKAKTKLMRLTHQEFVRRFSQHILPKRFIRIRHYGILSSTHKRKKLPDLQKTLGLKSQLKHKPKTLNDTCPTCKKGRLKIVLEFDSRGPPALSLIDLKDVAF